MNPAEFCVDCARRRPPRRVPVAPGHGLRCAECGKDYDTFRADIRAFERQQAREHDARVERGDDDGED